MYLQAPHIIQTLVDRHMEDAAFLWLQRDSATYEPHYDLDDLVELEEQLEAHLDGLKVAAEKGAQLIPSLLQCGEPGECFVAAWLSIALEDGKSLSALMEHCVNNAENHKAAISGFAWDQENVALTDRLLSTNAAEYLQLGVRVFALQRKDPQQALQSALNSANEPAPILRVIGELGRQDLLTDLRSYFTHQASDIVFTANWSAALLGDWSAIGNLTQLIVQNTPDAEQAIKLVARKLSYIELKNLLEKLLESTDTTRVAIQGMGYSGDPFWLPILLTYMAELELARVAGEAFALITGLDLAYMDMDKDWPDGFESGPNEDPMDDNVQLDADLNLPWPDTAKLQGWWQINADKFTPGQRYLCGKAISKTQCYQVLKNGYQRQRHAAALELALMGEPYFNVCAPALQQKARLDAISDAD